MSKSPTSKSAPEKTAKPTVKPAPPRPPHLLHPAEADALVGGTHSNPFAVFGPHEVTDGYVIRAFLPQSWKVVVVGPAGEFELERIHPEGLFAGRVSKELGENYRLKLIYGDLREEVVEDPYRYPALLGDLDIHLLIEGSHLRTFEKLGAHLATVNGVSGTHFAVWAPNARRVSVVGDFNGWDGRRHVMRLRHDAGVWEIFIPGLGNGTVYKYELIGKDGTLLPQKADPYGHYAEVPPKTASIVWDTEKTDWQDGQWMAHQANKSDRSAPVSIYEVHLESWRRVPEDGNRSLTYLELADQLADYVTSMGFTHVEFLPVHEYPFSGSWGYQPVGLFAPTSRFGTPDDFRTLVERLHQRGVGVIIDWVAGHFPSDSHGLHYFDGTHLYEHEDPRLGMHKDWNTLIYNYGRTEVTNYLYSNALYWLEEYHIDGLRVDAVASMLYLDYSRNPGEWIPNCYGGNENLDAINFLRRMNEAVYHDHPGSMTIAEESTAWPMVSRPTYLGGLGFGYKWNMGWMHDTLRYISKEPIHRRYHHDDLTFGLLYAFHENFVLPISHDEVVHGKGSVFGRMPGDRWQRFANMRAYYAFMWTHPGKKLLFMGQEFAQEGEWNYRESLDWHLLDSPMHDGVRRTVRDLNNLYRSQPALHELDCDPNGFAWIDCNDRDNSVLSFIRKAKDWQNMCAVVCNFTPVVRDDYRIGVPLPGRWVEVFNSDQEIYGGSGVINSQPLQAEDRQWHGQPHSVGLRLPPLGVVILKREG